MTDVLQKHRVIGIRSALRPMKDAGLISQQTNYPAKAVEELKLIQKKANGAIRHRKARDDASTASISKNMEKLMGLPTGSVILCYPNGRKAPPDAKVGSLKEKWAT